jgi:predicted choloylglycine hydrolase
MRKFLLLLCLILLNPSSYGQEKGSHTVAGGADDFLQVQHYRLRGSNREIGREIAKIAKSLGVEIPSPPDHLRTKLRYRYILQSYPQLYERMTGVGAEYGIDLANYSRDLSVLDYSPSQPHCSVVFYPATRTANAHPILSRNLDMPADRVVNGRHVYARPFVLEVYPDSGYPSLYVCSSELLGGAVEGVNSEGLAVAVLGDESSNYGCHPGEPSTEVGLDELQIARYLLDRCKNVEEAKESFLGIKQYYRHFPLHYIVADRSGKSVVLEFSRHRNQARIAETDGIQCLTNHQITAADLSEAPTESVERLEILKKGIIGPQVFTNGEIKEISSRVSPWMPNYRPRWPSSRTLWHSLYDLEARTVEIKFYLGEREDPEDPSRIVTRYSDYVEFRLDR